MDTQSIIMAFASKTGSDFPHQHTSSQPAKATRETLSQNKQTNKKLIADASADVRKEKPLFTA